MSNTVYTSGSFSRHILSLGGNLYTGLEGGMSSISSPLGGMSAILPVLIILSRLSLLSQTALVSEPTTPTLAVSTGQTWTPPQPTELPITPLTVQHTDFYQGMGFFNGPSSRFP